MQQKYNGKTVLVADDSQSFRRLEANFLAERGFRVLHAENGAEAVRMAVASLPDLILLDIHMPIMDGVPALKFLKQDAKTQHIPVIIVTTERDERSDEINAAGGVVARLHKPVRGSELWATIEPLMAPQETELKKFTHGQEK